MQEIASGIYIENAYPGVLLGAINMPHGLILIDAPPRPEDSRSWRSSLLNLGGGVDRLLVNLDAHVDRTLGVRAMECTVAAHEKAAQVFRNRPTTFKAQGNETGAEWELCGTLGSIRWAPPEITFSHRLVIQWDGSPIILEYHPGPSNSSIWIHLPDEKVVFVGDAVATKQPPFLANADLVAWIEALETLTTPEFRDYLIVSSRDGLVLQEHAFQQLNLLKEIQPRLDELIDQKLGPESTERLISQFLPKWTIPDGRREQYTQRLRWGMYQYYARRNRLINPETEE